MKLRGIIPPSFQDGCSFVAIPDTSYLANFRCASGTNHAAFIRKLRTRTSRHLPSARPPSPTRQRLGLRQSSGAFQPHDPDRRFCRGLFNNLTFHTPHSEICCFRFPLSAFDGSQSGSDPVRLGPPRFVFRRRRLVRRLVAPACPPPL